MPTEISSLGGTVQQAIRSPGAMLGKDDFLKMLIMQLRFQDPLEPMKGTEFAAQLAQFSSVEQLSNINSNLAQSIDATATLAHSINNALATTFIGKEVRAAVSKIQYAGTGDVRLGFALNSPAASAQLEILDGGGTVVRTLKVSRADKGDTTLTWDGKDDAGNVLAPGSYTFRVDAKGNDGASLQTLPFILGSVKGIRYKPEGTVFVIDGMEVALSDILEITEK